MRLYVYVLEAKGLPPSKASVGAYVKLRVGNHKSRTRTVRGSADFVWNEEFVFRVDEGNDGEEEEIKLRVFYEECDGGGGGRGCGKHLVGRVRVTPCTVLDEGKQALPPTWFSLRQPRHRGRAGYETKDCVKFSGNVLLTALLYGRSAENSAMCTPSASFCIDACVELLTKPGKSPVTNVDKLDSLVGVEEAPSNHKEKGVTNDKEGSITSTTQDYDSVGFMRELSCDDSISDGHLSPTFEELVEIMQTRDDAELPENFQGGVLFEQIYMIKSSDMNFFLFGPDSKFRRDLAEIEGTSDYQEGPWAWKSKDDPHLWRSVSYTKAATKLVKAVKAVENQCYLKADGKNFAVMASTRTPDVPYGDCFEVHLMYKITPVTQISSSEESTRLVVSWKMIFHRSTIMRSMIEGTARQGLKESYEIFANLLAQRIKPSSSFGVLDKNQLFAPLELNHLSDWVLAIQYFQNFTVISAIFIWLYVLVHILLTRSQIHCLEFNCLDFPDTIGELFTSGILFLQGERVFRMIAHFVRARFQRDNDHGVKAHGDGWLLTVALIEGDNLHAAASRLSDPYVVFSCNGKTRTSSVQLQTLNPKWNEILEFDAMEEPPAVLEVEVFDFDGPFDLEFSLGRAEINFLKHTSEELIDIWVPLEGKPSQASQSMLHLRIFLDNTMGVETVREYLRKMEKEVGKKLIPRSPQKNSTFQKIFALPPEEFLINDFSCYLKRKLPLQGRIFLSARILGFYSNFFGRKTKFFFLWEDIEDIQIVPPSFATVGSPALLIILRSGRCLDARHGAKCQDDEGRLKFQFQSFASFGIASKTIMALGRTKSASSEQGAKLEEDQRDQDWKNSQSEDSESLSSNEDTASMSNAFSSELAIAMESILEVFEGGQLEKKIMEKVGCLNYLATEWKETEPNVHERQIHYKFNRHVSIFGGEVISTQHRTPTADTKGWMIDEAMTLHGIPFSDQYHVNVKYKLEALKSVPPACQVDVFICITWSKRTKFRKRISRNVFDKLAHRSKEIFVLCEKEISSA